MSSQPTSAPIVALAIVVMFAAPASAGPAPSTTARATLANARYLPLTGAARSNGRAGEQEPAENAVLGAAEALAAARAALEGGRVDEAIGLLRPALDAHPDSLDLAVWLGHAHRIGGDLPAAAAAYARAERISPGNPGVLMGRAALYEASGDLLAAAEAYALVIATSPAVPDPWRLAGDVQMQLGNHPRAVEYYTGYSERMPQDVEALNLLGIAHYFSQQHDAAIAVLERALEVAPGYVPARYSLGVVLADRPDRHDRALELLTLAADAGWEEAEARYLVGRILADRGDHAQALDWLTATLQIDPEHIDAHYRLARVQRALGDEEAAQETSRRFEMLQAEFNRREADDKEVKALRNAVSAALAAGNLTGARAALADLVARAPDDADVLVQAAKVELSLGNADSAMAAASRALTAEPEHWEALYLQGLILSGQQRHAAARVALEQSLRTNPNFADTYAMLGTVLLNLRDPAAAVAAYRTAADLEPGEPGHYLNLASALARAGDAEGEAQAMATYRRLLREQSSSRS